MSEHHSKADQSIDVAVEPSKERQGDIIYIIYKIYLSYYIYIYLKSIYNSIEIEMYYPHVLSRSIIYPISTAFAWDGEKKL